MHMGKQGVDQMIPITPYRLPEGSLSQRAVLWTSLGPQEPLREPRSWAMEYPYFALVLALPRAVGFPGLRCCLPVLRTEYYCLLHG
jgi:hypothetical protein